MANLFKKGVDEFGAGEVLIDAFDAVMAEENTSSPPRISPIENFAQTKPLADDRGTVQDSAP